MQLLRTLLSVAGNRHNMIQKARDLTADVLILDLEDSVPSLLQAHRRRDLRPVYTEGALLQEGLGGMTARQMFGRSGITNSGGKVQA
jgi:hypothetical protein